MLILELNGVGGAVPLKRIKILGYKEICYKYKSGIAHFDPYPFSDEPITSWMN